MVCAALLGAGCGDRASNDAVARNDRAVSPNAPSNSTMTPTTPAPGPSAGARAADAIDDSTLTVKVKTALIAEPGLKSTKIDVSTKDAVVTLTGSVPTSTERAKARQVAENVQGVRNVVDNLTAQS
jgi:hyperosmotically inducible protein